LYKILRIYAKKETSPRIITEMPPPYRTIKVVHHYIAGLIFVQTEDFPGGFILTPITYRNIIRNFDDAI